jgi:hypothetical protein
MAKVDFREEVLNVALAELLEQRGMLSVPETIRKSIARKTRDLPDILVGDLLGIYIPQPNPPRMPISRLHSGSMKHGNGSSDGDAASRRTVRHLGSHAHK